MLFNSRVFLEIFTFLKHSMSGLLETSHVLEKSESPIFNLSLESE